MKRQRLPSAISCLRAPVLLPVLLFTACSPAPSTPIVFKSGAFVRVINLTPEVLESQFGNRSVTPFAINGDAAPFVLVPPSMKTLEVKGPGLSLKKDIKLVGGEAHTFICYQVGKKLELIETIGDPRNSDQGKANIRVTNTTSAQIKVVTPINLPQISSKQSSDTVDIPFKPTTIEGTFASTRFKSQSINPESSGAYTAIVYQSGSEVKARILRSNPPMQVQGASQGR